MFPILDIIADDAVATARFACDLGACHGACCTMAGGRGAPITDAEKEAVIAAIPVASPYLSERNRGVIATLGAVEGSPGDWATRCIDDRDCVFVYYEGSVAKCAIERAHFNGQSEFRKPLSCHLFPIRVSEVFGTDYLRYEEIPECRPALANGRKKGVLLYQFLKDALVRAYGEEFYADFAARIEKRKR